MRRLILVLLCAVELLVFTGRGGLRARYREVEQLLVIQTMGLDDYRGGVTLSLAAMGEADRGVTRLRADGASISAAMERIRGYSYEDELFCPHIRQLLIGEQAAEQGVEPYLAYVCRSPELRLDLPLYVVRGDRAERAVMDVGSADKGICDVMKTVEQRAKRGSALVCALELGPAAGGGGEADAEPLSAAPLGYAILREGKLCRYLTREQAIAVGFLRNEVGPAAVQLQGRHGETAVLEILSGSSRIRPVWEDGALRGLKVSAEARADILELGGRGALRGAEDGDWLTAQLEAKLSQYLSSALQASGVKEEPFLQGRASSAARQASLACHPERAQRVEGSQAPDMVQTLGFEILQPVCGLVSG